MQVSVVFALIVIGYVLSASKIISKTGASDMSDILLTIVTPCVLINAYQTKLDMDSLQTLAMAFAVSIVLHIVMIVVSNLYFAGIKSKEYKKINTACGVYSNCGFMAIPLLAAAFGNKGVFYGSAYLAVFNCFVWTHGIHTYSDGIEKFRLKKMILNPGIIGTVIAMTLYFLQIKLPAVLSSVVGYVADLNTPLAMLLLGSFLARTKILSTFRNPQIYAVSVLRLIIFPLIAIVIFMLIGADRTMSISVLISVSCPTAAIAALFAEKYNMDSAYAAQVSSVTTLYSLITIPVMVQLATVLIK